MLKFLNGFMKVSIRLVENGFHVAMMDNPEPFLLIEEFVKLKLGNYSHEM